LSSFATVPFMRSQPLAGWAAPAFGVSYLAQTREWTPVIFNRQKFCVRGSERYGSPVHAVAVGFAVHLTNPRQDAIRILVLC
jgi:hypothetical protein